MKGGPLPYVFPRICVDKIIHFIFLEPMRIRELDFLSVDILMYSFMGLHLFVYGRIERKLEL